MDDLRVRKVRVQPVSEGPVEDVPEGRKTPIEVRGRLHHPEDVAGVGRPEESGRVG